MTTEITWKDWTRHETLVEWGEEFITQHESTLHHVCDKTNNKLEVPCYCGHKLIWPLSQIQGPCNMCDSTISIQHSTQTITHIDPYNYEIPCSFDEWRETLPGYWVRTLRNVEGPPHGNNEVRITKGCCSMKDGTELYYWWDCVTCAFENSEPFFKKPKWYRAIRNFFAVSYYDLKYRLFGPKLGVNPYEGGIHSTFHEAVEAAHDHVKNKHGEWERAFSKDLKSHEQILSEIS